MLRLFKVAAFAIIATLAAGQARAIDPFFPTFGNNGIDVVHYGLDLDVTPTTGNLNAWAVLDILAEKELTRFALDLHALTVSKVTVNGVPAGFGQANDKLIIAPRRAIPKGMLFRVYISYSGVPDAIQDPTAPGRSDIRARLVQISERDLRGERAGRRLDLLPGERRADRQGALHDRGDGALALWRHRQRHAHHLSHDRKQAPLRLGDGPADDDVARHGSCQSLQSPGHARAHGHAGHAFYTRQRLRRRMSTTMRSPRRCFRSSSG